MTVRLDVANALRKWFDEHDWRPVHEDLHELAGVVIDGMRSEVSTLAAETATDASRAATAVDELAGRYLTETQHRFMREADKVAAVAVDAAAERLRAGTWIDG